jgi:hypothetical protein
MQARQAIAQDLGMDPTARAGAAWKTDQTTTLPAIMRSKPGTHQTSLEIDSTVRHFAQERSFQEPIRLD